MAKRKKRSRQPKGTGGLRFDEARGLWVGRVPIGRYPSGGVRYTEVTAPTQAECVRLKAAAGPPPPSATLAEFAGRWFAAHGGKPATRTQYASSLRRWILPELGHLRLADVTPGRVEALAAKILAAGRKAVQAVNVLSCLRAVLKAAERDGVIGRNPVSVARKPRKAKKKIDPFTPAELRRLIDAAAGSADARTLPVALLAATGCRIGEAVGLDAADFDPAAGTVVITKTTGRHGTGTPKSANGVRTIRVPAAAVPALVRARGGRASGPLFAERGRRVESRAVRETVWYDLLDRLGLRRRTPHEARHSVATAMIAAGVPLGDVARYLGDSVETIVATYLHPTGADPAAAMDRLFGGP